MKTHNGTRVNADAYGNPRYVWHFLDISSEGMKGRAKKAGGVNSVERLYDLAVEKARKIGGKRYRGRDFGGGIVFTTYSPEEIQVKIDELKNGRV